MAGKENVLPWPNFKQFFSLKESDFDKKSGQLKVLCLLCVPRKKYLSVDKSSSSNLRRHLQKVHPSQLSKITKVPPGKRKMDEDISDSVESPAKQLKLSTGFNSYTVTQNKVDKLVLDYIVKGLHAFRTVEREEFQDLIQGLQPGKTVMTRKTLVSRISDQTENFKADLRNNLLKVSDVATTADCWKTQNRSFMGITVHWIDNLTFTRKMAVLACRRMIGRHTYLEIGKVLQEVHEEYAIQNKTVATTTDNGSNFVKSFRVFGTDSAALEAQDESDDVIEFIEIAPILDENGNGNEENMCVFNLPQHERCAAHTLNLVATTDIRKAETNVNYKRSMRGALARCQALWNKQSSSTQNADTIKNTIGVYFVQPNETRWNSLYDALSFVEMTIHDKKNEMNQVCDSLALPRLREDDITFIKEYCKIMKPVASALDCLQGEKKAYMGLLLPVLHSLRRRLLGFAGKDFVICAPLLEAVIGGLDNRFSSQWFRKDLVLAAVTHPEYRLSWIKDSEKEEQAKNWLSSAIQELRVSKPEEILAPADNDDHDEYDLFDFSSASTPSTLSIEQELTKYFTFPFEGLSSLNNFPYIKTLFLKYNTPVPSSAAVERVFSVSGEIFTNKRGRISDENFENVLQLKFGIK